MKKDLIKKYFYFCALPIYSPLLIPWLLTDQGPVILGDLRRWLIITGRGGTASAHNLLLACMRNQACRTIYFHRLKCGNFSGWFFGEILRIIYRPLPTLKLFTHDIGPGLFIQHGYCTIVSAKSIGPNAWINQGVTIGYTNDTDCPSIGDNVTIGAGAKVLGDVTIGNNVVIGANAVVVKNVPDDCVVVGVPARIIRRNGVRVNEAL